MYKTNNTKVLEIKLSTLMIGALLYIIIPVIIFFWGWLKTLVAIPATIGLLISTYFYVRKTISKDDVFYINKNAFIFLLLVLLFWVSTSGIGGIWVQRWDHHARNAVLRDLIDYPWPVIYPKTGNALVYYFVYWLVPALVGKVAGWFLANLTLLIWSYIGIIFTSLLLCYHLKVHSIGRVLVLTLTLIFWGGLCFVAIRIMDILGWHQVSIGASYGWTDYIKDGSNYPYGYQYTPNTGLIKWVFNQTIVPWLISVIFLINKQRISHYAFIGLLMLPYGPLPFIGMFAIMVCMGISQIRKDNILQLVEKSFSIENVLSIIILLPIFYLFFKCNVTADSMKLYVPINLFTLKRFFVLVLFYLVQFGIYAFLIFKDYKKEPIFWIVIFSLIIIPNLQIGVGHDFCMRASIPALFILMIMVLDFIFKHELNPLSQNYRLVMLIISLTFGSMCAMGDYLVDIKQLYMRKEYPIVADDVKSFSERPVYNDPEIFYTINFLSPSPEKQIFFKSIGKKIEISR